MVVNATKVVGVVVQCAWHVTTVARHGEWVQRSSGWFGFRASSTAFPASPRVHEPMHDAVVSAVDASAFAEALSESLRLLPSKGSRRGWQALGRLFDCCAAAAV